jgi:hypothetical protein
VRGAVRDVVGAPSPEAFTSTPPVGLSAPWCSEVRPVRELASSLALWAQRSSCWCGDVSGAARDRARTEKSVAGKEESGEPGG